jgi:hypothetical protein
MTDTPERIWAYPSYVTGWSSAVAHDRQVVNSTEYVRADLSPAPMGVRVKPLVWTPNTDYRHDGLIAGDHSGFWTTHKSDDSETWEWADPYGKATFGFKTQALAIASLEAERSARILSALEPAPEVAALVDALRAVDSYLARGHDKMAYNITRAALAAIKGGGK